MIMAYLIWGEPCKKQPQAVSSRYRGQQKLVKPLISYVLMTMYKMHTAHWSHVINSGYNNNFKKKQSIIW